MRLALLAALALVAFGQEVCNAPRALTEEELLDEEDSEMASLEVRLLQTRLQPQRVARDVADVPAPSAKEAAPAVVAPVEEAARAPEVPAGPASQTPAQAEAAAVQERITPESRGDPALLESAVDMEGGIMSLDHNGNICMLCNKPLPERVGGKNYSEFRRDCGGRSSKTGPSADDLALPAVSFLDSGEASGRSTNGFCELNFAKSCVDAVANQDYLYWPKSLDLDHASLRANAPWDARYCHLNGFLEASVVKLQHNFTGMRDAAAELCRTKYAKHDISKLTFLDMMQSARYEDQEGPSLLEAERLAAWNCAMGDLGCDIALCTYSFCHKGEGKVGLYSECAGWNPVQGMPSN